MKLIALVVALLLERLAAHLLHLRELRWFDRYFDWGLERMRGRRPWLRGVIGVALMLAPVVPVAALALVLLRTGLLWDVPYFLFAVLVLLFSLGPRDLGEEVRDYCEALTMAQTAESLRIARELLEARSAATSDRHELTVEEAILVQGNNRIFGVVFFFVVLGPVGAWLFRVSDLFRRRAVYESDRAADPSARQACDQVERVHGALAWLPARLTALGYALAGSFEDAFAAWREYRNFTQRRVADINDEIVALIGIAALRRPGGTGNGSGTEGDHCQAAMRLVWRSLFVWITVIALMTLFGWAV